MWHVDPTTRVTTTDARYRAIFGTTEEWTDYLQAVAVIHPDDQPAVLEAVAAATRLEDPTPTLSNTGSFTRTGRCAGYWPMGGLASRESA